MKFSVARRMREPDEGVFVEGWGCWLVLLLVGTRWCG